MGYKQIIREQWAGPGTYDLWFASGGRTWAENQSRTDWDSHEWRVYAESWQGLIANWELAQNQLWFTQNNVNIDSLYMIHQVEPSLKLYPIDCVQKRRARLVIEALSEEDAQERLNAFVNAKSSRIHEILWDTDDIEFAFAIGDFNPQELANDSSCVVSDDDYEDLIDC